MEFLKEYIINLNILQLTLKKDGYGRRRNGRVALVAKTLQKLEMLRQVHFIHRNGGWRKRARATKKS